VVSLLPWRYLVFYSGGVDPVVLGKAAVGAAALALACLTTPVGVLDRIHPRTLVLVTLYLMVGLGGALAAGEITASAILAVRVLMVAVTVLLIVASYPPAVLVNSLGMATGPLAGGLIYDAFSSYAWLYIASWAMGLGAFLMAMNFKPFPKPRVELAPAAA
jgi:hypothetical protein